MNIGECKNVNMSILQQLGKHVKQSLT